MTQKNTLPRQQFNETRFNGVDYEYNFKPGEFIATIDGKVWGKGKKLFTYMTFADGRRIVAMTCPRSKTEGLAGIEEGSQIRVLYIADRSGIPCVRRAALVMESTPAGYLQRLMQQGKIPG